MSRLDTPLVRITAIAICIAVAVGGYLGGRRSAENRSNRVSFLVAGESMAPTLPRRSVCQMEVPARSPSIGEVVVVRWGGKTRVKRIAGVGGDSIEFRGGRLHVNGRRLEDQLHRREPALPVPPALVPVPSRGGDWERPEPDSPWLIYTHRNPHQAGRNTPVMDDYPTNTTTHRLLHPVDRLVVQIVPAETVADGDSSPIAGREFNVLFHQADQAVARRTVGGVARCGPPDAEAARTPSRQSGAIPGGIDASHPIAIQVSPEDRRRLELKVFREIEYRQDETSLAGKRSVVLEQDEVFVVGDNVPVSVDSRQVGPIKRSAILGTVVSVSDPTAPR